VNLKEHAKVHGEEPYMAVATHFNEDDTYVEVFVGWSKNGLAKDLLPFVYRSADMMKARGVDRACWCVELKSSEEELRPEATCGICGWDPYEAERELTC
jgi:hypothetical protein